MPRDFPRAKSCPRSQELLRELPGFGAKTTRYVSAFAFRQRSQRIDGIDADMVELYFCYRLED